MVNQAWEQQIKRLPMKRWTATLAFSPEQGAILQIMATMDPDHPSGLVAGSDDQTAVPRMLRDLAEMIDRRDEEIDEQAWLDQRGASDD